LQNLTDRLNSMVNARSVVMIGASSDKSKWGFIMLNHLVTGGFAGHIYPVNPTRGEILGLKVYRAVADLPETPDLAVIVVPPPAVPGVIGECVRKGITSGIIITAGFAELGAEGGRLQQKTVEIAREGGMVFLGPNCNGVMSPWNKQYIQFPAFHVPPGHMAVIAQSGNVLDALARQIMLRGQGCSVCIASGNEASLHIEDFLEYLGDEPNTRVILCYIEGFKDGQGFLKVAESVSRKKPIIMLKAGKTQAGARAAASHTAAIAGADAIVQAACKQAGVIRVGNLDEMLNIGFAFLSQPMPKGRRLGILTSGGGLGVLAADACAEQGFEIVRLPDTTLAELDKVLPAWWSHGNPVDLVAGATVDNVFKAAELVMACPAIDATLFMSLMLTLRLRGFDLPVDKLEREKMSKEVISAVVEVMDRFAQLSRKYNKPMVAATEYMWSDSVEEVRTSYELGLHNTVCYHQPHEAAQVMNGLARYSEYLKHSRA
jgi:acyl-CoA synthetase (NDP forming)